MRQGTEASTHSHAHARVYTHTHARTETCPTPMAHRRVIDAETPSRTHIKSLTHILTHTHTALSITFISSRLEDGESADIEHD